MASPKRKSKAPQREKLQPVESVAESVEKHISTREFSTRAEHLTDDISRQDELRERHLREAFNRKVGSLGGSSGAQDQTPASDTQTAVVRGDVTEAAVIARALADPQNIRQAVILSEIMTRPESRW